MGRALPLTPVTGKQRLDGNDDDSDGDYDDCDGEYVAVDCGAGGTGRKGKG